MKTSSNNRKGPVRLPALKADGKNSSLSLMRRIGKLCRNGVWMMAVVFLTVPVHGQADSLYQKSRDSAIPKLCYARPQKWGFVTHVPNDLWQIAKSPFQKKNIWGLSVVAASSAILIWQDQHLMDGAGQLGRNLHMDPETSYKVVLKSGDTKILKLPQNINTALYQMGEGGTSMLIAGGLFIYGKIGRDQRALQTASDLTETFISMGVATQILKRAFGRQSPFVSTRPSGAWHPFPSLGEYQRNTPEYDGFPSGHLATMMATVTVLSENYPEKKWIRPIGYTILALSGFAMMNTQVHWAGDYPLALALGYISGKITVKRHRHKMLTNSY